MTFKCDLHLQYAYLSHGSAHRLTEGEQWVQFYENLSKASGDMERTRILRVNPMTLNCNLELDSAYLNHGLCTPLLRGT